ncbi:hypothetical protein SCHPADRAFT_652445 [Schizopora paradoxa]|uniref:Uncharacterized protein n=1 Tax=Schizopora paradoxa TaxID=27342 RepID=A0A0H2R7M2_9AGAM|nr:hypothetical protein SCHPADRAFT_652445 [Schizopora paradoxa]
MNAPITPHHDKVGRTTLPRPNNARCLTHKIAWGRGDRELALLAFFFSTIFFRSSSMSLSVSSCSFFAYQWTFDFFEPRVTRVSMTSLWWDQRVHLRVFRNIVQLHHPTYPHLSSHSFHLSFLIPSLHYLLCFP